MIRALVSLAVIIVSFSAEAQYPIQDMAFATSLQAIVPSAMNGNVLDTNDPAVLGLQQLNVNAQGISNLDGIQFFTGLKSISCSNNQLDTLPVLPNSVEDIFATGNQLLHIESPLPASLDFLGVALNQLTQLPSLPPLTRRVNCDANALTSLPALPNNFDYLTCSQNQLTSLPTLPGSITFLQAAFNSLEILPLLPQGLEILNVSGNPLYELPALPLNLERLGCQFTYVSCLPPLPNGVETINCNSSYIRCLPNVPSSFVQGNSNLGFTLNVCNATSPCFANPQGRQVAVKVFLDGPLPPGGNLMNDDLRNAGLLPVNEPYTALGYSAQGVGPTALLDPSLLNVSGPDALVDWVIVELRNSAQPALVVKSRFALLQRDGDVVDVNGVSPVIFDVSGFAYRVAIRHRNHFSVCSGSSISVPIAPGRIDFTDSTTSTWGINAQKSEANMTVMWAGDVNANTEIKYVGTANDRDEILMVVGGTMPTNTVVGYSLADVNLDGVVKYTGISNDRDVILSNIGGGTPTNTLVEQLP